MLSKGLELIKYLIDSPWILGIIWALARIPFIGIVFRNFNTLIHELGHILTGFVIGAEPGKIALNGDASGTATVKTAGKFKTVLVALAGYPFASFIAALFTFAYVHQGYWLIISCNWFITAFSLIFLIRNWIGVAWAVATLILSGTVLYFDNILVFQFLALVITITMVIESMYTAIIIGYLSILQKEKAGDCSVLNKQTKVPAFLWSLIFIATSFYFFEDSIYRFTKLWEIKYPLLILPHWL